MKTRNLKRGADASYWRERLFHTAYTVKGEKRETKDWCVRFRHAGKRKVFNMGTANRDAAAQRARDCYQFLFANGWEKTEAKYKHTEEKARVKAEKEAITVGEFLEMISELATDQSQRTLASYGSCLRRVVGEITGESPRSKEGKAKIEGTPLEKLTETAIDKWKAKRLKDCKGNPKAEEAAKTTANSILRGCRALFGRKFVPKLKRDGIRFPDPLPFSGVQLFTEDTSGKFSHEVKPEKLVKVASAKLDAPRKADESEADHDARKQVYLAFILAFAAGLRKREADCLEWSAVDLEEGQITIQTTEFFKPKTKASAKPVKLDPETVAILRGFRARNPKDRFVLRSKRMPRPGATWAHYRAKDTWKGLVEWLVEQGITDPKPVHYCRKAITALMAKRFGIFAAQRHARHTTPQVTARYYSDSDESIAPGIGALFGQDPEEVEKVVGADFQSKKTPNQKTANA